VNFIFKVIRKSNIGDYDTPVIWEGILDEFETKEAAEEYIKDQIKQKPYLKYDRLYIQE
jgi:hypothetical protein